MWPADRVESLLQCIAPLDGGLHHHGELQHGGIRIQNVCISKGGLALYDYGGHLNCGPSDIGLCAYLLKSILQFQVVGLFLGLTGEAFPLQFGQDGGIQLRISMFLEMRDYLIGIEEFVFEFLVVASALQTIPRLDEFGHLFIQFGGSKQYET